MALSKKIGSFAKSTGAATATQSETSFGFTPKLVLFFMAGPTADNTWTTGFLCSIGAAGGTSGEGGLGHASGDALASSDSARRMSVSKAIVIQNRTNALLAEADCTLDADGFTLSWTTNNAVAYRIGYIALGGSDITNVSVGDIQTTTTGNVSTTTPGFMPDIVLLLNSGGYNTYDANVAGTSMSIGAMTSSAQWGVMGLSGDAQATTNTYRMNSTSKIMLASSGSGSGSNSDLAYVSMDANGFTVNAVTMASARRNVYVAVKGGRWKVGSFNKSTGAATAVQSQSSFGFPPSAVLLVSDQNTATATAQNHNRFGIGASDGSTEYAIMYSDTDNLPDSSVDSYHLNTCGFIKLNNDTQTLDAKCDVTMDADGFTTSWTTNDAVATQIHYIAVGSSGIDGNVPLEQITLSAKVPTATVTPDPTLEQIRLDGQDPTWNVVTGEWDDGLGFITIQDLTPISRPDFTVPLAQIVLDAFNPTESFPEPDVVPLVTLVVDGKDPNPIPIGAVPLSQVVLDAFEPHMDRIRVNNVVTMLTYWAGGFDFPPTWPVTAAVDLAQVRINAPAPSDSFSGLAFEQRYITMIG